jgi:hypothetical protein
MFRSSILILVSFVLFQGCATVHSGNPIKASENLLVSAMVRNELSTAYFTLVEFTFENTGKEWLTLAKTTIDLGDPRLNDAVIVVAGADLKSWGESMTLLKNIKDKNLQTFLGSVSILGLIGGSLSSNSAVKTSSGLLGASAFTALSVTSFKNSLERASDVKVFPETHLYANDIRLPPGLFLRRWIVFYSPTEDSWINEKRTLDLNFTDANQKNQKIQISFRDGASL